MKPEPERPLPPEAYPEEVPEEEVPHVGSMRGSAEESDEDGEEWWEADLDVEGLQEAMDIDENTRFTRAQARYSRSS